MALVIQLLHCTAVVSLYNINCLVLIMEVHYVLVEVVTAVLYTEWRESHLTAAARSQLSTSQHTTFIIFQRLILCQAVHKKEFIKVRGRPLIPVISKTDGLHFKPK